MIIDSFSHALHGKYLDELAESGGAWTKKKVDAEKQRAVDLPLMTNMAVRLDVLDETGIDLQVIAATNFWDIDRFPGNAERRLKVTAALNNNLSRIMEDFEGRFLAIGSMTLREFGSGHLREMERAIKVLGLKGLCIQSNINGKPPDAPEFEPFWAKAVELDIPVYIHPQDPIGKNDRAYEDEYDLIHNFGWPYETTIVLSRLVFSGLMDRYPKLKIVSHHLGGMVPFYWGRILEKYAPENQERTIGRVMPKPLYDYFSSFFYDTAVGGNASAIKCACDTFGASQLVFATDSPFGPDRGIGRLQTYPGIIRSLGLSEQENHQIFEGNIRKILNYD